MFALEFHFPSGRYHATPWGRHVNEADVAWPPEPWRILRALIACYWRKTEHTRWDENDLSSLINQLSKDAPLYHLPDGAVHSHTRHYMPVPPRKTTLVFDGFAHLPKGQPIVVAWPDVVLDATQLHLASDLAQSIGYLGRAESWTECSVTTEWNLSLANCKPVSGFEEPLDDLVRVIAPIGAEEYLAKRERLISSANDDAICRAQSLGQRTPSNTALQKKRKGKFGPTLPERLVDALTLDSSDYKKYGWSRPPASREILYQRPSLRPVSARPKFYQRRSNDDSRPQIARYLLAGRPRPRIERAVRVGEILRIAALSQFGWEEDLATGRRRPKAPTEVSGRDAMGRPMRDPAHSHAFWISEDADCDGEIDHLIVYIPVGMDSVVRNRLDQLVRLWVPEKRRRIGRSRVGGTETDGRREWRLALEGFGVPKDFSKSSHLMREAREWISVTPFLAAGHLKRGGYPVELRRLMKLRGDHLAEMADEVEIDVLDCIQAGGSRRHALHFQRSRSRGGERQLDASGAMVHLKFPTSIEGPISLGYGCHFGLGLFQASRPQVL